MIQRNRIESLGDGGPQTGTGIHFVDSLISEGKGAAEQAKLGLTVLTATSLLSLFGIGYLILKGDRK